MSRSLKKDSWEYGKPLLTLTVTDDNYIHGFDLQKQQEGKKSWSLK